MNAVEKSRPLSPEEVANLLRLTSSSLQSILSLVPAQLWTWHPGPEEWCINEVVGHLIEAEQRGFAGRIRILLEQDRPVLQTWDQEEVARERRDCERPLEELVAELRRLRTDGIALLDSLLPEDLQRGGDHVTVGYISVIDLMQEWVYHDQNHLRQILGNIQQYVWPQMANTQRFY